MLDVVYILATLGVFAGLLAYVRGCEALGRERAEGEGRNDG